MKNFVSMATLTAAFFAAPFAFADSGSSCHFHGNAPIKEAVIADCASKKKDALASGGQIEASWKLVKLEKAQSIEGKKAKEWKLTFTNPTAKDATKQTLFMFYSLTGNFIAANFTGK